MNLRACRMLAMAGCLWLLLAALAHAASGDVRASLDRDHAQLGDTVTLNVQIDGTTGVDAPDVSALSGDFDILGTSRNTSIDIVNGQRTQRTLWAVALRPTHTGTLTIPSLTVDGQRTAPLTLTVVAAPATAQGGPGDPVFIEATLDNLTPYVGQQVGLTVRLYYAPNLTDGSIDKPHADGVQIRPLGRDTRYQAERGGRRYHVVEQRYALIPQHAGHIALAPLAFHGRILGADDFSSMFGGGQPVQARSPALALQVRTRPDAARGGPWLPARKLSLSLDGLPGDGRVQVGEPLTLTLDEQATGLPFEALPTPTLPALDGVQVYPDKPHGQTGADGPWLQATRTRKFAVIPQRAGPLVIPEITLRWWNVVADRAEVARISSHTLTVTPAAADDSGTGAAPAAPVPSMTPVPATARAPGAAPSSWRTLALLGRGLWLLTLVGVGGAFGWRRWRRARAVAIAPAADGARRLRNAWLHAVRGGDVATQAGALLAWARAERPALRNLGELAAALDAPAQRDAIAVLQQAHYAAVGSAPDRDALARAFAKGFAWRAPVARPAASLPPLYPS
jgi:hypothetical protein